MVIIVTIKYAKLKDIRSKLNNANVIQYVLQLYLVNISIISLFNSFGVLNISDLSQKTNIYLPLFFNF